MLVDLVLMWNLSLTCVACLIQYSFVMWVLLSCLVYGLDFGLFRPPKFWVCRFRVLSFGFCWFRVLGFGFLQFWVFGSGFGVGFDFDLGFGPTSGDWFWVRLLLVLDIRLGFGLSVYVGWCDTDF